MRGSLYLLDGGTAPDGRRLYRVVGLLASDEPGERPDLGMKGVHVEVQADLDATDFGGVPDLDRRDLNSIATKLKWPIPNHTAR